MTQFEVDFYRDIHELVKTMKAIKEDLDELVEASKVELLPQKINVEETIMKKLKKEEN